ncbi:MAG TPA: hypothetical protein VKT82_13975 [Ktedonobacterales bacterium]|nr:hypothetical protein [Ktedonobacterales bacterium]
MEAFFLSIASLFALLVLATALCVVLRFGITSRVAPSSGVGEEFMQPRRHILAGALTAGLVVLFSVTLLFAVATH